MKNRIVAAVLAVMVAGALTACSSGSKTESTTQTTAQATTQAAKETQAKTTEAKATEAKTTEAKATEAKTTEAKTTEAKTTEAKATEAKTTEAKTTEAKTTEAKATEAKTTEAKAAEAKTTEAAATEAAETEAEKKLPEEAQYTIYNQTGEKVTEIKFTRNDTGKVALDEKSGLADGASTVLKIKKDSTVTDKTSFTFSFTTEGGYTAEYKTLGFEVAPMTLIAEDAKSGATPFKFEAPAEGASTEAEKATEAEATEKVTEKVTEAKATEKVTEKTTEAATEAEEEKKVLPDKAEYTFNNKTGEQVTEIKLVDNTSKKVVEDLKDGLEDGKSVKVSIKKDSSITDKTSYTLTFTTKSGYKAEYKTLGFEVAGINLIAEDAKSGATPIEFVPEAETEAETEAATEAEEEKKELPDKAEYTFNNATGEKVTEIKLVDNTSKKVVEDLKDGLEDGKTVKVSIDKDSSITDKTSYTLTFTTKSGYKAEYKTLGFEVATIKLISEDAKSGATPIEFEK
ncbi:hypothetical protein [Porcincola intestinalis]|uniref:hypothetical protein n=1 Tax=Porcincola intestinalis TaxID=2606632 RepID=UPI0023F1A2BE|nr:hypothetical protein [Porcincola intestinalis]MCI6767688.1 hypothetical protein [Lachnospiraceae bacterium]MDD7060450.1 hypothetical protein [Porcincola intestinalis]MDY5282470.1 hypothetical protein [Porcincola intestinalis]